MPRRHRNSKTSCDVISLTLVDVWKFTRSMQFMTSTWKPGRIQKIFKGGGGGKRGHIEKPIQVPNLPPPNLPDNLYRPFLAIQVPYSINPIPGGL